MLQTNYTILNSSAPGIAAQLVGLTGNPAIYGYNTPINIVDIQAFFNDQFALSCIPYCTTDTLVLGQNLGISMIETMLYVYTAVFPGDSALQTFLYNLNLYLNANVTTPDRFDYCGVDLGGSQLITLAQLNDDLANLQAKVNALDYAYPAQTYYTLVGHSTSAPFNANELASINFSIPFVRLPELLGGILDVQGTYILYPIMKAISLDQYVNNTFDYNTGNSVDFYQTTYNPTTLANESGGGVDPTQLYNYSSQSANWMVQAAASAYNQVLSGSNSYLGAIYGCLQSAADDFASNERLPAMQAFSALNGSQNGLGTPPPTQTGQPLIDVNGQTIIDAGLNRRAQLLRDYNYVLQFDLNADGIIEPSERITMEYDILKQKIVAEKAALTTILNTLNTQLGNLGGVPATLSSTITLYAS